MKKVYFVRHGESEGNAGNLRGSHTTPLTEKGIDQAAFIADRLTKLPIQALIASTMVRAQQTAEVISKRIGLPVESSDLFVEARTASSVQGQPRDTEEAITYTKLFFENFGKEGWKYSDEESFFDLKERARKGLELLAARPEEHVAVVMHGYFIRIVLAYAVFGEALTPEQCLRFTRAFHMENTGLSIFGYLGQDSVENSPSDWWVSVWNDHAHLG